MSFKCFFHPEKEAITKCESCGKKICLECKMVFNDVRGVDEDRYNIKKELCPECYKTEKSRKMIGLIIMLPIFVTLFFVLIYVIFPQLS